MKFKGHVSTGLVGSKNTFEFELPDEDFEGLTDAEREHLINEEAMNAMLEVISWDYEEMGQ
jgi:hypothetical protein